MVFCQAGKSVLVPSVGLLPASTRRHNGLSGRHARARFSASEQGAPVLAIADPFLQPQTFLPKHHAEGPAVDIRLLDQQDAAEFVRLRLEALTREPYAFARTPDDALPWPLDSVPAQLRPVPEGNFLMGAFAGRQMIGQAGFFRLEGAKERHKGRIWGVYVTPAARGQGAANAMLTRMLDRARGYPGLEQVSLSVAVTQETARTLYDALGFRVYGYERRSLKVGEAYVDEEDRVLWLAGDE